VPAGAECSLKLVLADDLARMSADKAAEPCPQQAQLPTTALEVPSLGIASRHHRGAFGDTQIRLPQLKAVRAGRRLSTLIAPWTSLASIGKVMAFGLHGGSAVTR
jgi:hypothetical protein